ncbi:hypothetical protein ACP4OV_026297 [Aristida adscensionis]
MQLDNQVIHVEKEQPSRVYERKRKGLISASNSGLQLRRSKRLAKDSPASMDEQPVIDNEHKAATGSGNMIVDITVDEQIESEPDEQQPASPIQSCSSLSPRQEILQTSSDKPENLHSATQSSCSNPVMSDPVHLDSDRQPVIDNEHKAATGSGKMIVDR